MPLVAHNALPTFEQLHRLGHQVLSADRAARQDIRELHIGFLNMMPDAALTATERQFISLVGASNQIAQFYIYPFSIAELNRGDEASDHVARHYFDFTDLQEQGLDALIITGANVANPALDQEPFWEPLLKVARWAEDNVASMLCSCLATHALVKHFHGIERRRLPAKQWGVYGHSIRQPHHPLMRDINTRFDAPHSRYNEVAREPLEEAGVKVLVESEEAGVHMAVSPDGFRTVYFQGHPEYDANSLLKEYKREVNRYLLGEREQWPRFPENYFSPEAKHIAEAWRERAVNQPGQHHDFPEDEIERYVDNTWRDTGKAIVNNWLGLVYQLTNLDRRRQFMDGVNPENPLGLKSSSQQ